MDYAYDIGTINELFQAVAARTGSSALWLEESGSCAFEYRGTFVRVEFAASAEMLQFSAPLTGVHGLVPEGSETDLFRLLLSLNLSHPDLMGANFALLSSDDLVVLQDRVSVRQLDAALLEARLAGFLYLVEIWSARLLRAESLAALAAPLEQEDVDEMDMQLLTEVPEAGETAAESMENAWIRG